MNSEVREITISRSNIVDQIASFLYAASIIDDDVEITNIQFGELFGAGETELVPIKIHTRKEVSN